MFLKLQVFHFPRNKSKSHVFSFFKKRPSKLFNYRKTNICIPQEIFLFSTFDYSNLSFHFSNNQDKKKTLFTINKKKKREKIPLRKYPRSKLLRSNEWIFSNIYNYRYSSSRFISMHPSTIDCIHPPFQPSQLFIVGRSISDGRNVS